MAEKTKNVLTLNSKQAFDFFLKSEQYHGFELPEYLKFDTLLDKVRTAVGTTPYEKCLKKGAHSEQLPDVNFNILLNKDGRYAVRPIMLANPFLYYFLVREICGKDSWAVVKQMFEKFSVPHITSSALPVVRDENTKEAFPKSTIVLNWWNAVEQRSVELSLEYRYMFVTDITNCYGSVNPQVFDWAFSFKDTAYETSAECAIPKNIQKYLRAFQQGRNIGIPQGSAIFDFLAEMILGYADLLLHEAIEKEGITVPYEVIRYRDDYRIFCNDRDALEQISYLLQGVLEKLNFRMNSGKTRLSEDLVTDSIKPDKLAYIYNTPILNKKGDDFDSFEKHLLFIRMFARKYPNSGTVQTLLSDLDKRIEQRLEEHSNPTVTEKEEPKPAQKTKASVPIFDMVKKYNPHTKLPGGSERALAAICVRIALENVGRCHYALRVMSRIVDAMTDEEEKWNIIKLASSQLRNQPNSTYCQLWLQNITYQRDKKSDESPYNSELCRVVAGEENVEIWNNTWLKNAITKDVHSADVVDSETLKNVTPVIKFIERGQYDELSYNE